MRPGLQTAKQAVVMGNVIVYTINYTHALVAISKGMREVKLCTNKILQFLTGGAG